MKPKLVFTGGGTAGHVVPNIALMRVLASEFDLHYIGSAAGVERVMIEAEQVPYHTVRSGKLRRYFSWKNFLDPFNVLMGIVQAFWLLLRLKPQLVFSKGGFVALPVVVGAWLNRIPVIAHESDLTPGLANRLSFPFVSKICVTFEAGKKYFKTSDKVQVTGTPIRSELFQGTRAAGLDACGFSADKPCLLVVGGSQGAGVLNTCVREQLQRLGLFFQVIHLCGKGNLDPVLSEQVGYVQLEYADATLPDLFAAADVVLSRAGANALYEILALEKPHVLIPLSRRFSRGDQVDNADYFKNKGVSTVFDEEHLDSNAVCDALEAVYVRREAIEANIRALKIQPATSRLVDLIRTFQK